jgi:hypothetical protein
MFRRLFRTAPIEDRRVSDWWRAASAAASAPSDGAAGGAVTGAIDLLVETVIREAEDADEHERQIEMIDGLRQLAAIGGATALPVLATQHRVVGDDPCHVIAPASLVNGPEASGKVFVTTRRIIFSSGGAPLGWPWHRVRAITRHERDVCLHIGHAETVCLRCNTFGDAIVATHVANRLLRRPVGS